MILNILPSSNYLESLADIILEKYSKNISELKVILPSVSACLKLQQILTLRSPTGAAFLPLVVPIVNIGIGSEGMYQIPSNEVEPISYLEQKIITSFIIAEEKELKYSIAESLSLSGHVIRLFDELLTYGIELRDLDKAAVDTAATHWQLMIDSLLNTHTAWQMVQKEKHKIDLGHYRQNMLRLEVSAVANNTYPVILAAVIPRGVLLEELVITLCNSAESCYILPQADLSKIPSSIDVISFPVLDYPLGERVPSTVSVDLLRADAQDKKFDNVGIKNGNGIKTHPYYQISRILELCGNREIKSVENSKRAHKNESTRYEEAENIRAESQIILNVALEWLKETKQVAIVTGNRDLINICTNLFEASVKLALNMNGYELRQTRQYEFFMLLLDALGPDGEINLEKFITLLKTTYLFSEEVREFEKEIRKKHITDFAHVPLIAEGPLKRVYDILESHAEQFHFVAFGSASHKIPKQVRDDKSSHLKLHITLAEKLAPSLWEGDEGSVFAEFLYELLQIAALRDMDFSSYREFIKALTEGARYNLDTSTADVVFMNLEEASIGSYDYIIFADMNEGSIPRKGVHDPWMNNVMRNSLGLPDSSEILGTEWYYFNNLLNRKHIYITRCKKYNGLDTEPSRFVQQLISEGVLHATK